MRTNTGHCWRWCFPPPLGHIQVWSTSTCEFVRTLNGHKRGIACLQYRDRLVVSGSSDNTIRYVNNDDFRADSKKNPNNDPKNVVSKVTHLRDGLYYHKIRQVMGHWVRGMFASPGRARGACALHPLWQQKDCQRRLWWVSHAHTPLCALRHTVFVLHTVAFCSICSKIKVWDLQAALDPRAPASTLCLRTLVVRGTAILVVFRFWLAWSIGGKSGMFAQLNLGCSRPFLYDNARLSPSISPLFPGAFWTSVSSSVWWVSDHQQFSWRHHSDLGFPERLNQWPARGAVSLPHLHVYY